MKIRPLKPDEIEVRIAEIRATTNGNMARLLLYKTARTDMDILDETYGPENWQVDYKSIDGKLYCGIGVRIGTEWIWKWNTGTESNMEAQKGEASDAMKRSGFCWGTGRELYTAPDIVLFHPKATIKENSKGKLACYDRFSVREIDYTDGKITRLVITNTTTGVEVFAWGKGVQAPTPPEKPVGEYACEKCGKPLRSYVGADGRQVTAFEHARRSKKVFGKVFCMDCVNDAKGQN